MRNIKLATGFCGASTALNHFPPPIFLAHFPQLEKLLAIHTRKWLANSRQKWVGKGAWQGGGGRTKDKRMAVGKGGGNGWRVGGGVAIGGQQRHRWQEEENDAARGIHVYLDVKRWKIQMVGEGGW